MLDKDVVSVFDGMVAKVEGIVDGVVAQAKADLANIPDEAAMKAKIAGIIKDELNKVLPLATIEGFVNARLPMILRPIAPWAEGTVIPKLEADVIGLIVNFIDGEIDKKLGADWFAKMKAAI